MENEDKGCLVLILLIAIGIYSCWSLVKKYDAYACSQLSKITGLQTRYSKTAGCFVKDQEGFIPEEIWKDRLNNAK